MQWEEIKERYCIFCIALYCILYCVFTNARVPCGWSRYHFQWHLSVSLSVCLH